MKWLRGASVAVIRQSLRSSERGLKSPLNDYGWGTTVVAPFVGAWIEIFDSKYFLYSTMVAPFVGAWIEIYQITRMSLDKLSRSVRRSVD